MGGAELEVPSRGGHPGGVAQSAAEGFHPVVRAKRGGVAYARALRACGALVVRIGRWCARVRLSFPL